MVTNLLDNLNDEQRAAATHLDGPLLIVAGAGTGKTTVLINRLVYLIVEQKINPDNILVATFTEKAAAEMTERADRALPYGFFATWINTFHGLCDRILKEHGLDIGLPVNYKLVSQTEQWILLKKNLAKFNLDYYRPLGSPTKFIDELLKHFSRLKDENVWPQQYLDYAESLIADNDKIISTNDFRLTTSDESKRISELANAYHVYNKLLLDNNLLDFGDLIIYAIKLLRERPDILQFYRAQFQYIMVDEFQDTNWAQYELIKMLAAPKNNLVAVGDDDQAIYKFRGASLSNIMQFKDDFAGAQEIVLTKNYRSGQTILDHAYQFITHNNPNRLEIKLGIDKKLVSLRHAEAPTERRRADDLDIVKHLSFATDYDEARQIALLIKNTKQENDASWSDFAILIRANSAAQNLTKELTRQNIPNLFLSLRGLYFKPIILDCLAYLKLLDDYHDSSSLFRVLNIPAFSVGYQEIINLNRLARQKNWSLYEALKNAALISDLSPATLTNINRLLMLLAEHSGLAKTMRPSKIFLRFVNAAFAKNLDNDRDAENNSYLNQFYKKIISFEERADEPTLKNLRELLDLEMEAGETGALKLDFGDVDTVKILTVHSAKGLEFDYVIVANLVDKRFPTINRSDKIALPEALVKEQLTGGDFHLEEERRLFYVAMTRARKTLYLTSARDVGGAAEKKPSKFIAETGIIDSQNINAIAGDQLRQDLLTLATEDENKILARVLPTEFSFSQLETYNLCPLKYKFLYLLKIPMAEAEISIFGRLLHNVLRQFLLPLVNLAQGSLFGAPVAPSLEPKQLTKIFQQQWNNFGYDNVQRAQEFYQRGLQICHHFAQDLLAQDLPKIICLEKPFKITLGEYVIRGVIDRVDQLPDGSLEILDYKTNEGKDTLTFDNKKQLLLYTLALQQLWPETVINKLTYYRLLDNTRDSFEPKEKDLVKVSEQLLATIEQIRSLDFSPNPGHACGFCAVGNICEFKQR